MTHEEKVAEVLDLLGATLTMDARASWLLSCNPLLDGRRPVDMLGHPDGADEVVDLLLALADGVVT